MAFEWIQCSFFLKKVMQDSELTINLTPYHKLMLVHQNCEIENVKFEVSLQFERPLNHSEALGWNWHKSWTIPDLRLNLISGPYCSTKLLNSIGSIYAEICAVKPVISKEYSLCVEDIGLDGTSIQRIQNNTCVFSGLKFSGTSYNCEGSGFHLLVMVYTRCSEDDNPQIRILLSRISSPIFVDSRKSVRQNQLVKFRKVNSYLEPFEIHHIQKTFTKKESRKSGDCREEKIENNSAGLVNYFGAANIRYKVKHPLFLAIKFSQCFYIFYKKTLLAGNQFEESVVHLLQTSLNTILNSLQQAGSNKQTQPNNYAAKSIIFVVEIVEAGKTIPQFLEIFQSTSIGCLASKKQVPAGFEQVNITDQLIKAYADMQTELSGEYRNLATVKTAELSDQNAKTSEKDEQEESPKSEKNKVKQQEVFVNAGKEGCQNQQSSQSSSWSSDEQTMQRPDIPLKCEIILRPIKKKPYKLQQILQLHDRAHEQILIECEKKDYCTSQLCTLNSILRSQLQSRRERIAQLKSQRENPLMPTYQNTKT